MKKYILSIFLLGFTALPNKIDGISVIRGKPFSGFQLLSGLEPIIQSRFLQEDNDFISNENVLSYFPNPLNNPERW